MTVIITSRTVWSISKMFFHSYPYIHSYPRLKENVKKDCKRVFVTTAVTWEMLICLIELTYFAFERHKAVFTLVH